MKKDNQMQKRRSSKVRGKLGKIMNCFSSNEQLRVNEEIKSSSESFATKDYTTSINSSQPREIELKADTSNIEEAELTLREHGSLNYEEARALLGRYEYQKGNIEAALHVFEGIDINSITPKIKASLSKKEDTHKHKKRSSQNFTTPPMSINTVSLILEAILLKAKSLQSLGRFKEAAQSCGVILDIIETSLPSGLPENFGSDIKLHETINKAVELSPQLWNLAESTKDSILSYRRALLHHWNLDSKTISRIQKDFAVFLLYSGGEIDPPNLRSQIDTSYVPRNNIEEAILLLMILLKKVSIKRIEYDPSILDHLTYALSISGGLNSLAKQIEELFPMIIDRKEMYHILSLCYHGEGDDVSSLNLLRKLLHYSEDPIYIPGLLMASKICGENSKELKDIEEGKVFANKAIENLEGKCDKLVGVANCMLGVSLSAQARLVLTDNERAKFQFEALKSLEIAGNITNMNDANIVYHLCLENAEQRKLDSALFYAKRLVKLENGANYKGWLLLARILSAQKRFLDGENVINSALDQTGKWDQGELLLTKAKLQIAQNRVKDGFETYSQLLAILQVQRKSLETGKKLGVNNDKNRNLEIETWNDLASIYIKLSRWSDVETCLLKSGAIDIYSASRYHVEGLFNEAKGEYNNALKCFMHALDIDPAHVPSLVCMAIVFRKMGSKSYAIIRSFLMEALRIDRMNVCGWYNLGLLYKDEGVGSVMEAADCFEAAASLEETQPIQPFR